MADVAADPRPFPDYAPLEQRLDYTFSDRHLLRDALTMPSWRMDHPDQPGDNQRLEFFGDAVVDLLAAEALFALYPAAEEGELTRMRSRLTSGTALGARGRELDLKPWLLLGRGEALRENMRTKAFADALEAIFGAVWLDGGIEGVRRLFRVVYPAELITTLLQAPEAVHNPKGELLQLTQSVHRITPVYTVLSATGPQHNPEYSVEVRVGKLYSETGKGPSRRSAEAAAAANLLKKLKDCL